MQVTVQSIVQLIKDQENEEVRELLRQLEDATTKKDKVRSKEVLRSLADKSWDAFLKVLPYILENWGRANS
jgi:cyclopropane fatty-acyl-phospholipid synthase-like methyltransferase